MMKLKAVIFDVDGTLVDSERHGHWPACNQAFRELGLPFQWTWDEFRSMLDIPGNGARLRYYLKQYRLAADSEIEPLVQQFMQIKQRIYNEQMIPQLPLRQGVRDLIDDLLKNGVRLAIVSTSHESQIHALLRHHFADVLDRFDPVLGKETGLKVGPEGRLYSICLQRMNLEPEQCVAVEDSGVGTQAAIRAGIPVVVVRNDVTRDEDFTGAAKILDDFHGLTTASLDALLSEVPLKSEIN